MVVRFVLSGIVLLCSFSLFSQGITSEECFAITQFDENYIIRLDGIDYNDNDKAFICKDDLPVGIEIRYKTSGDTVIGENWDWALCNCGNPEATSYAILC